MKYDYSRDGNEEMAEIYLKPKYSEFIESVIDILSDKPGKPRGYLYVISCESGKFKIGKTKCISRRLKELQTASFEKLQLIFSLETSVYGELEKICHEKFYSKRISGEWFVLNDYDLFWIRNLPLSIQSDVFQGILQTEKETSTVSKCMDNSRKEITKEYLLSLGCEYSTQTYKGRSHNGQGVWSDYDEMREVFEIEGYDCRLIISPASNYGAGLDKNGEWKHGQIFINDFEIDHTGNWRVFVNDFDNHLTTFNFQDQLDAFLVLTDAPISEQIRKNLDLNKIRVVFEEIES